MSVEPLRTGTDVNIKKVYECPVGCGYKSETYSYYQQHCQSKGHQVKQALIEKEREVERLKKKMMKKQKKGVNQDKKRKRLSKAGESGLKRSDSMKSDSSLSESMKVISKLTESNSTKDLRLADKDAQMKGYLQTIEELQQENLAQKGALNEKDELIEDLEASNADWEAKFRKLENKMKKLSFVMSQDDGENGTTQDDVLSIIDDDDE